MNERTLTAINELQEFFESDLWTKFGKQDRYMKQQGLFRKDVFKNESEFQEYLDEHFKILKDEIETKQ